MVILENSVTMTMLRTVRMTMVCMGAKKAAEADAQTPSNQNPHLRLTLSLASGSHTQRSPEVREK